MKTLIMMLKQGIRESIKMVRNKVHGKLTLKNLRYQELKQQCGNEDYDENGRKTGEWVELVDNFEKLYQIIEKGKYVDGVKVGDWNKDLRINGQGNFVPYVENELKI